MCALGNSTPPPPPSTVGGIAGRRCGPVQSKPPGVEQTGSGSRSSSFVASGFLTLAHERTLTYAARHRWMPFPWTRGNTDLCPVGASVNVLVTAFRWSPPRPPASHHRQDPTRMWEYGCLLNAVRDLTRLIHVAQSWAKAVGLKKLFVCLVAVRWQDVGQHHGSSSPCLMVSGWMDHHHHHHHHHGHFLCCGYFCYLRWIVSRFG